MTEQCSCCSVMVVKDLNRWFKEKWVDVSRKDKDGKHPPCGRSKAKTSSKGYPKCRPSVKVSSKTPKTSGSMTEGQKRAATKRKRAKKQGVGGKPTIVKLLKEDPLHPQQFYDWQAKNASEPMDIAMRLLKTRIASPDEDHPQIGRTVYDPETNEVLDSSVRLMPTKHGRHNEPENFIRDVIHEDMHTATLPEVGQSGNIAHAEFPAFLGEEVYSQRLAEEGKSERRREPYDLERTTPFNQALYRVGKHPNVPAEDREKAKQLWFNSIRTGEPMDIGSQLLKRPVSPEAKRHKLEYDTKYESTPERLKYREELKRERRHRGIDGKGGPDMSHTKNHTLVAEDPHTNRARHFKERGTLKGDPMHIAWLLLKFDLDQRDPDDMDDFERREEDLMRQFNRRHAPEQTLSRGQLRRLEQGRSARGQQTKNFAGNPEAVKRASEKLRATRAAQNQEMARRKLKENIDAAEVHPGKVEFDDFKPPAFTEVHDLFQTMHPSKGDIYNSRTYGTPPLEAMKDSRMRDAHVDISFNNRDAQRAKTTDEFDKTQALATLLGAMGLIPPEAGIYLNAADTGSKYRDFGEMENMLYGTPRVHMAFPPRVQIEGASNPSGPYPTFQGLPFRTEEDSMFGVPFTTGEPMDLAFRLLKGDV